MKLEIYTLSAIVLVVVELVCGKNVKQPCDDGMFYDEHFEGCRTCDGCPINTIILRPCGYFANIRCGPFPDWANFPFEQKSGKTPSIVGSTKDTSAEGSGVTVSPQQDNGTFFQISDEWYLVSMVLLGVLCFISLVIALYIIFACFVCKKTAKEIIYGPEYITVSQQASPGSNTYTDTLVTASPDILQGCQTALTPIYTDDGHILMASPNIYMNHQYIEPKDSLLYGQKK